MKKLKLKLNQLQWQLLANDLKTVMQLAPVKGFEIETLVLAEMYLTKMKFFEVAPYQKQISLSLSMVQAYAINRFLGPHSENYNTFLRMMIEPKLLPGK
jgi:hypothetical protein